MLKVVKATTQGLTRTSLPCDICVGAQQAEVNKTGDVCNLHTIGHTESESKSLEEMEVRTCA
jgi:hypothetical protein